jgi:hypothetical protein
MLAAAMAEGEAPEVPLSARSVGPPWPHRSGEEVAVEMLSFRPAPPAAATVAAPRPILADARLGPVPA